VAKPTNVADLVLDACKRFMGGGVFDFNQRGGRGGIQDRRRPDITVGDYARHYMSLYLLQVDRFI
jgi:hypothetical protein